MFFRQWILSWTAEETIVHLWRLAESVLLLVLGELSERVARTATLFQPANENAPFDEFGDVSKSRI